LQEGFLIPNTLSHSSNARIDRNNVEAQSEWTTIIFSLDEFKTMQKKKGNDASKEEESHVATSRKNRRRGKKNVNFSII
jgi:hypothetical protein